MAKFRIRFKVQALELEIDGEREDMPAISAALGQQMVNLVQPADELAQPPKQLNGSDQVIEVEAKSRAKAPRRRNTPPKTTDASGSHPIDFRHDPAKYGNPLQTWSATEKCAWLLFVIEGITGTKEVSGPQLAATFNSQFKASGRVHPPHVTRDLSKAKVQNPAHFGEDKNLWFLTDAGKKQAKQLVSSVLNPS